jgi:hypothetical protein
LSEQQPLPFPAGHLGQRTVCEVARTHCRERILDHAAIRLRERRYPPALTVKGAGDNIQAAHPQFGKYGAHLGYIADCRITASRSAAKYANSAAARLD